MPTKTPTDRKTHDEECICILCRVERIKNPEPNQAPDGTVFATKAELASYMDSIARTEWEAGRAARMTYGTGNAMTAEQAATRFSGNYDATMPSHIKQRHNLAGRS